MYFFLLLFRSIFTSQVYNVQHAHRDEEQCGGAAAVAVGSRAGDAAAFAGAGYVIDPSHALIILFI